MLATSGLCQTYTLRMKQCVHCVKKLKLNNDIQNKELKRLRSIFVKEGGGEEIISNTF